MALFPTWNDWLSLREDNARKRAIKGALNGLKPPLPGSYAACPSTNPRAMKVAKKKGVVGSDVVQENDGQRPDYSFDRWVQKAQEFGDDVNKMRTKVDKESDELDKKIDDSKKKLDKEKSKVEKEEPEEDDDAKEPEDENARKRREEAWKLLRKKHQDGLKQQDKSKEKSVLQSSDD
jgi:hypothetical protein